MPKISIVVPAYNAEKTIKGTMSDLLAQSYRDYEIVLVDDGSTDTTPDICDSYREKYDNVRVLHQVNGGLSNARNNGTKVAAGDYVTYVDSDDRVGKSFLERLVYAMEETGADIVSGRIVKVKEDFEPSNQDDDLYFLIEVFDKKQTISEMLTGKKIWVGACCRLVPRKWMIEEPFLEGKYYEDLSNTYRVNLKADKTAFIDADLYYYVMLGGSITARRKPSARQCDDYYEAIKLCAKGCADVFPDLRNDICVMISRDFMSLLLHIRRCEEKDASLVKMEKKLVRWIRRNWWRTFTNRKAPMNVRLRTLLCAINPWVYEKVYYFGIRFTGKKIE